jgi:hypothetical protein
LKSCALEQQVVVMLPDDVPVAARIEADIGAADHTGAVHQPHRWRAVGVDCLWRATRYEFVRAVVTQRVEIK